MYWLPHSSGPTNSSDRIVPIVHVTFWLVFFSAGSGSIANPPYNEVGYFFQWYGQNTPVEVGSILSGFSVSTYLPPSTSFQNNKFLYGDPSEENLIRNGDSGIAEFGRIVAPLVPVPEPATWAMLLIGFAGIGIAAVRRRRLRIA
jgi:hypothetical protein